MANERYGIFPARVGDLLLRQIGYASISPGQTKTEKIVGGKLDRDAIITAFADPMIRFRSDDLDTLLAGATKIDFQVGYRYDTVNAPTTTSTMVQYQHRVDGGAFDTSNIAHYQITSNKGFAYIEEIRAEQDSRDGAIAEIALAALSNDGIAAPLSLAQTSSGLTSTPLYTGMFYLGPIMIGAIGAGVALEGVTSVRIRPGIEYRVKRSEGSAYARVGSIHTRKPEVAFRLENMNEYYTRLASFFGATVPSNTAFYLQKGLPSGVRVGYATTQHIRFVATAGEWSPDQVEVVENDDATVDIVFRPHTMTAATGVAIA